MHFSKKKKSVYVRVSIKLMYQKCIQVDNKDKNLCIIIYQN